MKGTWQTTGSGGDGTGTAALVVLAAIVVAAAAGPVVHAVTDLIEVLAITVAALLGLALTAGAAYVTLRLRRGRRSAPLMVHQAPPVTHRPAESLPAPQPPAIERPAEVHLHFHGVDAAEVAELLDRVHREHQ